MNSQVRWIVIALSAAGALTSAVDAQKRRAVTKPLSDFQRLVRAAHSDKITSYVDKFATPTVDQSMAGKPFRIVFPVGNGETTGAGRPKGSAYYTYADGVLGLQASLRSGRDETGGASFLKIDERRDTSENYAGTNAYGARTNVQIIKLKEENLVILNASANSSVEIVSQPNPAPTEPVGQYQMSISVSGPEARSVANDVDMIVNGNFAPLKNGKLTACWTTYSKPTFDNPTELFDYSCAVGAVVSSISFVRRSNGMILKRWSFQPG
ncbi:hypothetical protein U1708_20085 [Sphingomonas sp. ZB1N12]|uniref:hypothetical protein n=1 Tax=Sphingomonas arabinosi TaxID=3096160 RepID=UPI002FCBBBA3